MHGCRPDPAAAAATCALLDEIEARCHALQQQLGLLSQPEHARLTALAQQHVAAVQQASQAALEREGVRLVGRRLKVYWPEDQAWYIGSVAAFRGGRHWVSGAGWQRGHTARNIKVLAHAGCCVPWWCAALQCPACTIANTPKVCTCTKHAATSGLPASCCILQPWLLRKGLPC